MKSFFTITSLLLILAILPQTGLASEVTEQGIKTRDNNTINAGLTPDSIFYFLDVALDNLNMLLTFNPTEKARKGLNIARERLLETKEMINKDNTPAANKAKEEHENALKNVRESITKIENANSTREIEEEIEIEQEIEEHEEEIETIEGELKIKIKIKGNITQEQQALIDSILAGMQNKTGEVKIEIDNEKDKTKIKIEQETGEDADEIENEIEEEKGLTQYRQEKALDKILSAEKKLNKTQSNNTIAAQDLVNQARNAYNTQDYKTAITLAKQAKELLEDDDEETEIEIEAEIEDGETKVKIETGGLKMEYTTQETNRTEIINEIISKTGLTLEQVEQNIKIEEDA